MRQVAAAISGDVGTQVVLMIRRGTQSGNVTLERMLGLSKGAVGGSGKLLTAGTSQPSPFVSPLVSPLVSPPATDSASLSSPPSERNQEIIGMLSSSHSEGVRDAMVLAQLPAPSALHSSNEQNAADGCVASTRMRRVSKEFERSQLFLDMKDAKSLNAIVAADCRHLIDDLESPAAFDAARERLIASRARLPFADMKKVSF